jgi:hypothetical protein
MHTVFASLRWYLETVFTYIIKLYGCEIFVCHTWVYVFYNVTDACIKFDGVKDHWAGFLGCIV